LVKWRSDLKMKIALRLGHPELFGDARFHGALATVAERCLPDSEVRVFFFLYECRPNWEAVRAEVERNGGARKIKSVREYARRAFETMLDRAPVEAEVQALVNVAKPS
jgi:hypothetical protein